MSQFRKDLVSGEWIIIAPERAKRPHDGAAAKRVRVPTPREHCPFEDPKHTGNWPPYFSHPSEEAWEAMIIPNKFPALTHSDACPVVFKEGIYEHSEGMGYHDLLILRDHATQLPDLKPSALTHAFRLLQERYRAVAEDPCLVYTSTHFNWGESAGASLFHPHFQILTLPIIPPQVLHSLTHSVSYFERKGTCVHCAIIAQEAKSKNRLVAENDQAIAFTPFASRQPYEVKIFPKFHLAHFEDAPQAMVTGVIEILQTVLAGIRTHLNDPDLNFFIHTAPIKHRDLYPSYHWHIEMIPKISTPAGFELSTGVQINVVEPEAAARLLRGEPR